MDKDLEEYRKLEAEAVALVEESKRIEQELDREGLSSIERQSLLDRLQKVQKDKATFEADPKRKKLLAEMTEEFEREVGNLMVNQKVTTILATHNGGAEKRRAAAEASLDNNVRRLYKDPTNGYPSIAVANNSSRKRSNQKRKRSRSRSRRSRRRRTTRSY
jgi:hypothetical protein